MIVSLIFSGTTVEGYNLYQWSHSIRVMIMSLMIMNLIFSGTTVESYINGPIANIRCVNLQSNGHARTAILF